ncbi:MAG: glycosyl hydrolase [Gammaproteobacteria bacterium]|nr:glycosyl hydrolase [Gammaproteobacteria bacterium]
MFIRSAFLSVLLWTLLPFSATANELIANGSFETVSGGLPQSWTIRGTAPGLSGQADNSTSAKGSVSLRVTGRSESLDGPQQTVRTALSAAGPGRYGFHFRIKVDAVSSVRALLKYNDANGQAIDHILAEAVIRQPAQWQLVEGSFPITWQGSLQSAVIVFEVVQVTRGTGSLAAHLVPAYNIDDLSMDVDTDGDYIMDRDEAALGFSPTLSDTDGDGLPDRWERDHGFSPTSNESGTDTDGDGFRNLQEYFAATDPRDSNQYPGKPANPNANAKTRAVLEWLALLPSQTTAGHLAVGQNISELVDPTEYVALIEGLATATGKYPAILQMAIEPSYGPAGIPLQIAQVEARASAYAQAGGLVMLKWAMYNPWVIQGPGVQTNTDLPGLVNPDSSDASARAANQQAQDTMLGWMSQVADAMERLQNEGTVVMFRPLSEMNGNWFWWGRREQADYIALWRFIFDYFTHTRGLNNIIWVYESDSSSHAPILVGGPSHASDYYYPGDDYVDVMSHNLYSETWDLPFDSNEVYSRYPKIYGIPQAGPDKASRSGDFDNLIYVRQTEARLPRSSFFVVWNSFTGGTGVPQYVAIVDNLNATSLMADPAIVTRDELAALITFTQPPAGGNGENTNPDISLTTVSLDSLILSSACANLISNLDTLSPALSVQFGFIPQTGEFALQGGTFIEQLPSACSDELYVHFAGNEVARAIFTTSNLVLDNATYALTIFFDANSHPPTLNGGNFIFGSLLYDLASTQTDNGFADLKDFAVLSIENFASATSQVYSVQLPTSNDGADIMLLLNDSPYLRATSGEDVHIELSTLAPGEHVFTARVFNAHFQRSLNSPAKIIVIQ